MKNNDLQWSFNEEHEDFFEAINSLQKIKKKLKPYTKMAEKLLNLMTMKLKNAIFISIKDLIS